MMWGARIMLTAAWLVWCYPFVFRGPGIQKRPSITRPGPTVAGLVLECAGICLAYIFTYSAAAWWQYALALVFCVAGCTLAWTAVKHLGKQLRLTAGLYEDHELVHTGPYAIVRHPIYAALLCMLLATIAVLTRWEWAIVALVLFIAGTEIRVRTEDRLLASRFPEAFAEYRRKVPAYLPFVR